MSYLRRVSRRANNATVQGRRSTTQTNLSRQPAIASQSPLADIDQRLHLDPFAQNAELANSAATLPETDINGIPNRLTNDTSLHSNQPTDPMQPTGHARSEAEYHRMVADDRGVSNNQIHTPLTDSVDSADSASQSRAKTSHSINAAAKPANQVNSEQLNTARERGNAGSSDLIDKGVLTLQADTASKAHDRPGKTLTTNKADISTNSSRHDASSDIAADLLAVQRWIADGTRATQAQAAIENTTPATQSIDNEGNRDTKTPTKPALATPNRNHLDNPIAGKRQSITRVEIGSIEVEVVAPPTPPAAIKPHSSQLRTTQPRNSQPIATRPFGWRQR